MEFITVLLGAGALGTVATLVGMVINRRNVKSEADARNLKTPAEVDNLVATVHRANIDSVLLVNSELRSDNVELRKRLDAVETRQTEQGEAQRELGDLVNVLQRGLASAYAYITTLLRLIEEHLPNVSIPSPPRGYSETQLKEQNRHG